MFTLSYVLLWLALAAYVIHSVRGWRWVGKAATGTTAAAWLALTAGLIGRGLAVGHPEVTGQGWPLTNRYEFALWFAWATLAIYLILEAKWRERRTGSFVLAVALLVVTYASLRPADEKTIRPLLPALRSIWLQIHVLSAAVSYGACGVAAGLGVMRLLAADTRAPAGENAPLSPQIWGEPASPRSQGAGGSILRPEIERAIERVVVWGFPWLTLGILSGAIWAQNAWGRYWGWDPKETWALIIWLWYLLILHLRGVRGWRGRRLAALVVIGFVIVCFTFAGLPWLVRTIRLESLHGF
jgi:cytochrome c-type biogenesis protein CcsB